jgi:hypothetical protein
MKIRILYWILLLPAVALLFRAPIADACTCTNLDWSASQHLAVSDVGFIGVVASIEPHPVYPGFLLIQLDVSGCWKGVALDTISIITADNDGSCGYTSFVLGGTFGVFATSAGGDEYQTGSCSGDVQLSPGVTTFGDLGPAGAPGDCESTPVEAISWGGMKSIYR